ncbi:Hypothetical predicted protein, partial [Olea europaea subsp. europaea]
MVVIEPIKPTPPVQESTEENSSTATTAEEILHGTGNTVESATAATSGNDSDGYETASETELNDPDREPEKNNKTVSNHDNSDGDVRRGVKEEERKEESESGDNELNE